MTKAEVRTLLRFNRWANGLLLDAAAQLPSEAFVRDLGSSHRSLRDTLVHLLWGEWLWLQRWQGLSPTEVFDVRSFPDAGTLRSRWQEVQDQQLRFLDRLTDAELGKAVTYRNRQGDPWTYPLRQMIQHIVNHSTYHRGQVVTLLRQCGVVPPPTDFLIYIDSEKET